jgi:thymidylate synthase
MNNLDKKYQQLLSDIIAFGVEKKDRTGTGTISEFGHQIRHDMSEGFPLLTTKKMPFKTIVTELLWFLRGDTNIKYLVDNGCHIWDGDAYKNYTKEVNELIDGYMSGDIIGTQPHIDEMFSNADDLTPLTKEEFINKIKTDDEFAKTWGELGPIYGRQWRKWKTFTSTNPNATRTKTDSVEYVDQITNLINDLKTNPDSRRLMVSAWNVGEMNQMVLPPCHYGFQVYTTEMTLEQRKKYWTDSLGKSIHYSDDFGHSKLDALKVPRRKLSLMWNQRSVDTFLGLPFNIASYGTLLLLLCEEVNMAPGELIGSLGDTHLYSNHIQQAKEQIRRTPYKLPTLKLTNVDLKNGEFDYEVIEYEAHPTIKAPLSN